MAARLDDLAQSGMALSMALVVQMTRRICGGKAKFCSLDAPFLVNHCLNHAVFFSSVDFITLGNSHNKNASLAVEDLAHYPIIPYSVTPEFTVATFERLSNTPRIVQHRHALTQESCNALRKRLVQFL